MASSGVDAITLDPWQEPGIPLDEQYRSWKQRIKAPYDKHEVDAYTRTRVILMNGIEVGAWNFSHHFSRSTDDFEIRSLLARTRMVEQPQQQTTINWLHPADQSVLEVSDLENVVLAETKDHADWELLGQLAEQLPNGKARRTVEAAVAEVEPQEDEHLGWAQAKLAELGLKALTEEPPPDPERLDRVVIEPDLRIKEIHAAPIDKRNLSDGAKLPSAQETPASRTSPGV